MRILKGSITLLSSLLLTAMFCNNEENPNGPITLQKDEFYIKGKVTDNSGAPVSGVLARLLNSGISSVTNSNGEYQLQGKMRGVLKKVRTANPVANDTLLLVMQSSGANGDSSEIEKIVVEPGEITDIPAVAIVQREIRAPLEYEKRIKTVVAEVYDDSFPEIVKSIDMWYDTVNKVVSSFAYFISKPGAKYSLYISVYDTSGQMFLKSPIFSFPDNAGNIVFGPSMKFNYIPGTGRLSEFLIPDSIVLNYTKEGTYFCKPEELMTIINGAAQIYVSKGLQYALVQDFRPKAVGDIQSIQVVVMDFGVTSDADAIFNYNLLRYDGVEIPISSYDKSIVQGRNENASFFVLGHFNQYYFEISISKSNVSASTEPLTTDMVTFIKKMSGS